MKAYQLLGALSEARRLSGRFFEEAAKESNFWKATRQAGARTMAAMTPAPGGISVTRASAKQLEREIAAHTKAGGKVLGPWATAKRSTRAWWEGRNYIGSGVVNIKNSGIGYMAPMYGGANVNRRLLRRGVTYGVGAAAAIGLRGGYNRGNADTRKGSIKRVGRELLNPMSNLGIGAGVVGGAALGIRKLLSMRL